MRKRFNHTSKGKIGFLLLVIVIGFATLFFRMVDLQLVQGEIFRELADGNRFYRQILPAERGVFFDRFGDSLVYNIPKYYRLQDTASLYSERQAVTHHDALQIMASNPEAVAFELERFYLYPRSVAPVVGYVGKVTAEDLLKDTTLTSTSRVGKMGLERTFDEVLRGSAGEITYEINALGKKQRQIARSEGIPGKNVPTTIDPYLSEIAYRAMGESRGAFIILDTDTGDVLTLVSTPTFNATTMSTSFIDPAQEQGRTAEVASFFTNPLQLFFNRAVAGSYPPGSIFKLITAVAGLETQALTQETTVVDEGVLDIGEYSYANWYFTQYGRVEGEIGLTRAIARSNDIFFYKAAEWIGPDRLAQTAQLFGLGKKTGIELSGEVSGLVPTPKWKEETIGEKWFLGNTFHMGIGQGDVLVSPLQMAQVVQTVAHRGTQCAPRVTTQTERNCHEVGVSEEHLELLVAGMLDACSAGGTAFPFFEHNAVTRQTESDPYAQVSQGGVACKTGTSEFGGIDAAGHRKTHGWFAAFFSLELPTADQAENLSEVLVSTESTVSAQASAAATVAKNSNDVTALTSEQLRAKWLNRVVAKGYPKNLVAIALIESDEVNPFKEGSKDAAPVVKAVFDWLHVSQK